MNVTCKKDLEMVGPKGVVTVPAGTEMRKEDVGTFFTIYCQWDGVEVSRRIWRQKPYTGTDMRRKL